MFLHRFLADQKIMSSWKQCFFWHPIGRFSEVGLHIWMPFVIFRTRSHERSLCHFQADFLSRHCFTLCIIMEAEPRIAKQYKCHHCCSCKNYWGKGMVGGKKSVFAVFWLIRRLWVLEKMHFGESYSMSNKLLLVARHILTMGLQKCL